MSRRATWLFVGSAPAVAALLAWGLVGLPDFGAEVPELGLRLLDFAVAETSATNVVGAVTYDIRGFDTLVEEFILFAAASGLVMLLRELPGEREEEPTEDVTGRESPDTTDALRYSGYVLAGVTVLVGAFVVAYGALTPGGGFQGGAILAAALLLVFLVSEYETLERVRPGRLVEVAESAGAAGLVLVAVGGTVFASHFFENYLPRGDVGQILAGGIILPVNYAAGLAVAGGFVVMVSEFLHQAVKVRG